MPAEAVRLHALVDLAEHHLGLRVATGARDAALGVDHEIADEAGTGQRREREQGRGRITAGRAHDRHFGIDQRLQLVTVQLGQTVDRLLEEVGSRVLEAVPARVVVGVSETEVGSEIDDGGPGRDEIGNEVDRRAVREGKERGVNLGQVGGDGEVGDRKVRVVTTDGVVVPVTPGQADDIDVRVTGQDPDQLGTDVPGRTDDPDP